MLQLRLALASVGAGCSGVDDAHADAVTALGAYLNKGCR